MALLHSHTPLTGSCQRRATALLPLLLPLLQLPLLLLPLVSGALLLSGEASAHTKGLYKTKAEAEKRARELGCKGTHLNNGLWMPCAHEAMLHQELRQE